ncbi:hypothetical protein RQM47_09480 [Rubrivirga sp. S365]|uniref:DUF4199 domain-containing protein n=1 Tax=Rubrivirga litoralis TaxID=3075598 RepID=A0ABU3BMK3_9BACT|nr:MULTISPECIES: hypothetical protein [unclassified Rubrivirga]MDT0630514.1 hypothetical protein [Rubrivirga sp. F394]MDT7856871.1 hypothetical protein [Rubrivirga sp. S365]
MPTKFPSIAIGAAVYAVLSVLLTFVSQTGGFMAQTIGGCAICLAALAGPLVAVWHYTSTYSLTVPAGTGAGLGAGAGALGGVLSGVLTLVLQAINLLPSAEEQIARTRSMMLEQGGDPAQVDQQIEMMSGFTGNPAVGIVVAVVIGAVVGAIAGAIGASVFKKRGARMDDPAV